MHRSAGLGAFHLLVGAYEFYAPGNEFVKAVERCQFGNGSPSVVIVENHAEVSRLTDRNIYAVASFFQPDFIFFAVSRGKNFFSL